MESDVSDVPSYVRRVPIPPKKRIANWNSLQSSKSSKRHFPSGLFNGRSGSHLDYVQLQNPSRDCLPEDSQHTPHSLQFLKHPDQVANFGQNHLREGACSSLERNMSIGQMIAACDAEKERLLLEASRLEEAEIRQRNAREWILQNNRTSETCKQREEEIEHSEEIYLQINGRKYIARPVETDCDNEEDNGDDDDERQFSRRSTSSDVHLRRKDNQNLQASQHNVSTTPPYLIDPGRSQSQLDYCERKESLEEVIMKDKMAMLSRLKQMKAGHPAAVSVDLAEDSSECITKSEPTMTKSSQEVKVFSDRFGNSSLQISRSRLSSSPSTSFTGSYHFTPHAGTSGANLSTKSAPPIETDFHKLSDHTVSGFHNLRNNPVLSPLSLSLPLSPGSMDSSTGSITSTQNNSPNSRESTKEPHVVAPCSKSGLPSTAGPPDVGSPSCQTTNNHGSAAAFEVKVEPDSNCMELQSSRRPEDNKCPVCSDEISGYHYGIYSCESCKGFFKRTVQNKRNERLRCARNGNCEMNLRSRKHCAACRFQKCINQGMKLEAIRGDRQRGGRSMYQGSSEYRRRQQLQVQQQNGGVSQSTPKRRKRHLDAGNLKHRDECEGEASKRAENPGEAQEGPSSSTQEQALINASLFIEELLVHNAFLDVQPIASCCQISGHSEETILRGICHLVDHHLIFLYEWVQGLPYFRELEKQDQEYLFRNRWIQLMLSHYCLTVMENPGTVQLRDGQMIDLQECFESAIFIDFLKSLTDIIRFFKALKLDTVECALLKLLVLLNSDVAINQPSRISLFQEKVQDSLFQYVLSRDAGNVRRVGDILLRFAEIEKLCHIVYEHFMFQLLAGQLSEYNNLCDVLKIR